MAMEMLGLGSRESVDMRSRHQRAGYMSKLPMSKPNSEKWQNRLFVAKDGFLLYYTGNGTIPVHFDTKPKGIVPLGGCKVEKVERGPKGGKFGLRITHPDFYAGRELILAQETSADQEAWLVALNNCSRVTMENALLGDSMIEKLRAEGTAAEKEKLDAMETLQKQALALKTEQEARLALAAGQEAVLAAAAEAEGRAKKKEEEMAGAIAEAERRKAELQSQAADMQAMVEARSKAIADAHAEYEKVQESIARARTAGGEGGGADAGADASAGGGGGGAPASLEGLSGSDLEGRARALEEEKLRLQREKIALERSMREMTATTQALRSDLTSAEQQRARLEGQLRDMSSEDTELSTERQMRKRLERKLQIAEDSLKRLDQALRKSGVKLDIDVFADVRTLMTFFEERVEENRRDANQIDIMKAALQAKRQYVMATARADGSAPAPPSAPGGASAGRGGAASSAAAATASGFDSDESGSVPRSVAGGGDDIAGTPFDAAGPLPAGWTAHKDAEGDTWYFNAATQVSSWTRPT